MNKETFLEELRGYIQILEEQEQEDILEEYAQHIDIKIQKGLSEEEAIQDFGDMKVLAAEILEAYHVKPGFGAEFEQFEKRKKPRFFPAKREAGEKEKASARIGRFFTFLKEKSGTALRGVKSGFRRIGKKCAAFAGWLKKPFQKKRTESIYAIGMMDTAEKTEVEGDSMDAICEEGYPVKEMSAGRRERRREKRIGMFFRAIGRGFVKVWELLFACCIFFLRLFWNMAWLIFALCCAVMTMVMLAGFGMLLVLFFQNYPLGGILLISLGGIMCFGALSAGAFSMRIRKEKPAKKADIRDDASADWGMQTGKEA